jgi:hypothetical protein
MKFAPLALAAVVGTLKVATSVGQLGHASVRDNKRGLKGQGIGNDLLDLITALEVRVTDNESNIQRNANEITNVWGNITAIKTELAGLGNVSLLLGRIATIENSVTLLGTNLDTAEEDIEGLESDVLANTASITALDSLVEFYHPPCKPVISGFGENVPSAVVDDDGWNQCFSSLYGVPEGSEFGETLQTKCGQGDYVMFGCRLVGSPTWHLLGFGNATLAFTDTGASNYGDVTPDGDIEWYFNDDYSVGFAPNGEAVNKVNCDDNSGSRRLCWIAADDVSVGFRCGDNTNLFNNVWERAAWTKDKCPGSMW